MFESYGATGAPEREKLLNVMTEKPTRGTVKVRRGWTLITAVTISTIIVVGIVFMADLHKSFKYKENSSSFSATNPGQNSKLLPTLKNDESKQIAPTSTVSKSLYISTVSNEYGIQNSSVMLPYTFLSDSFIIEPYKETTIALLDPYSSCAYAWNLTKTLNTSIAFSGDSMDGSIVVTVTSPGRYQLNVTESCSASKDSSRSLSMFVWVKYIRRELSSLNDVDREEFLDAFHVLWEVNTTAGMLLYGERYKSIKYFAVLHNDGGGNTACDEFHGGLGFLNNHLYLSAYMEQSLQLVNPRVALHYLEYSKYFESSNFTTHLHLDELDDGSWTEILTSKFFGSSDPITGKVRDGRWANTSVPYITDTFLAEEGIDPDHTFFPIEESNWLAKSPAHLNSPYGLLRSPWNYNPSPYLTRYSSVFRMSNISVIGKNEAVVYANHMGVTCVDYKVFFQDVKSKPLYEYLSLMEDNTHGIFHFTFGGVGGDPATAAVADLVTNYDFSYSNIAALAISAQPYFKKNLALSKSSPVNCTSDPWQNGALTTNATVLDVGGPSCSFIDDFFETTTSVDNLINSFFAQDPDRSDPAVDHIETFSVKDRKVIMQIIANMFPYDGDLAGAGAALDPLFWVAHGAMERTFQKAVLAGIFTDMIYDTNNHCSGHNYNATKLWLKGFYFPNETISAESLTNEELTIMLDPSTEEFPYLTNFIYDTASFAWCDGSDAWFEV